MPISRQECRRCAMDALAHYADSARLELNPLMDHPMLAGESPGDKVPALRELLRQAVEQLRPPDAVPAQAPEWLDYHLLWSRCIQRKSQQRISLELGLSRATFYRRQHAAMEAVAKIICEMLHTQPELESVNPPRPKSAIEVAMTLAREAERSAVDLGEIIENVREIIDPLLREKDISLRVDVGQHPPLAHGDPTVLRQILINIVAGSCKLGAAQEMTLSLFAQNAVANWRLEGLAYPGENLPIPELDEFAMAQELLSAYAGTMKAVPHGGEIAILFSFPISASRRILVVDDSEDTTRYYESVLRRYHYDCRSVNSGNDMWSAIDASRPDLILLDVLMPKEDGWLLLQRLQTLPEMSNIPTIVCSVLDQPSLALALGAKRVLSKPIGEQELIETIRQTLSSADTEDQRRP